MDPTSSKEPITKQELEQILRAEPNASTGVKRSYPDEKGEEKALFEGHAIGSPIRRMQDIRKHHLDRAEIPADKALPKTKLTRYPTPEEEGSPFGKEAARLKKDYETHGITQRRNVGFAVYHSPNSHELKYVRAWTKGPPTHRHAEILCIDELPEHVKKNLDNIKMVYTERAPCAHGVNCQRKLHLAMGKDTSVLYSYNHSPRSEEKFQKNQDNLGIPADKKDYLVKKRLFAEPAPAAAGAPLSPVSESKLSNEPPKVDEPRGKKVKKNLFDIEKVPKSGKDKVEKEN